MPHKEDRKVKKKMSKKKKILISIGAVLLLIALGIGGTYMYIRGQIYKGSPETETVDFEEQPGITNILCIGTDARKVDEAARADAIIIATIDNNHKKLKLTSIMRDTLVDIPGHGEQKINASLAFGGPELLMETIKENFGISLNKYVMVNFKGFQSIINAVGGIDVDIHDYEIPELNKFIGEYEKDKSPKITKTGMQTLDGQQALAYARIRKVGDGDYERTERQRRVIDLVAQKYKDTNVLKYPSIMSELLPYVKTNIEPVTILNYAFTASKFPSLQFEQLRVPFSEEISWGGLYKNKGWVLIVDKEQNAKIMNDFIFEDKKPDANSYSVQAWKDKLAVYMGQNEQHIKDNGPLKEDEETDIVPVKPTAPKPSTTVKPSTGGTTKPDTNKPKPETEKPKPEKPEVEKPKPDTEKPKPEPEPEKPKPEPEKPDAGSKPDNGSTGEQSGNQTSNNTGNTANKDK